MVYLPMSYLYGKKFVGPITPTIISLREEIYAVPYHQVDWNTARNTCAKVRDPLCFFCAKLILSTTLHGHFFLAFDVDSEPFFWFKFC